MKSDAIICHEEREGHAKKFLCYTDFLITNGIHKSFAYTSFPYFYPYFFFEPHKPWDKTAIYRRTPKELRGL
jgi:hypothetical protein